jgi:hypothetical protein
LPGRGLKFRSGRPRSTTLAEKRIWYYRENALNFGHATSREEAIEAGSLKLQERILPVNKHYAPLSEALLESIEDPFIDEVHAIIKVSRGPYDVRVIAVDEPYARFERRGWKFED